MVDQPEYRLTMFWLESCIVAALAPAPPWFWLSCIAWWEGPIAPTPLAPLTLENWDITGGTNLRIVWVLAPDVVVAAPRPGSLAAAMDFLPDPPGLREPPKVRSSATAATRMATAQDTT
jgi:hypothetical protein